MCLSSYINLQLMIMVNHVSRRRNDSYYLQNPFIEYITIHWHELKCLNCLFAYWKHHPKHAHFPHKYAVFAYIIIKLNLEKVYYFIFYTSLICQRRALNIKWQLNEKITKVQKKNMLQRGKNQQSLLILFHNTGFYSSEYKQHQSISVCDSNFLERNHVFWTSTIIYEGKGDIATFFDNQ